MKTTDEFLKPAQRSINWAGIEAEHLKSSITKHLSSDYHGGRVDVDPDTGDNILKIRILRTIPEEVDRHLTQTLEHAKNAFDQVLTNACLALGSKGKANFPWAQDACDLDKRLQNDNIPKEIKCVFLEYKPYIQRGTGTLPVDVSRALASYINNKHRTGVEVEYLPSKFDFDMPPAKLTSLAFINPPEWNDRGDEMAIMRYKGIIEGSGRYSIAAKVVVKDSLFVQPIEVVTGTAMFIDQAKQIFGRMRTKLVELRGS